MFFITLKNSKFLSNVPLIRIRTPAKWPNPDSKPRFKPCSSLKISTVITKIIQDKKSYLFNNRQTDYNNKVKTVFKCTNMNVTNPPNTPNINTSSILTNLLSVYSTLGRRRSKLSEMSPTSGILSVLSFIKIIPGLGNRFLDTLAIILYVSAAIAIGAYRKDYKK